MFHLPTAKWNKGSIATNEAKRLQSKALALVLAFVLLVTAGCLGFFLFAQDAKADTFTYDSSWGALDNSAGTADNSGWKNGGDGSQANPFLIKDADDLMGFANAVNSGTSFAGQFIQLTGLTQAEASAAQGAGNAFAQPGVIDLRKYNGSITTEQMNILWTPIGSQASTPFQGTLYGTAGVGVINLNYQYASSSSSAPGVYGLVGYNEGTVRDFSISFTEYATKDSDKNVTYSAGLNLGTSASVKYAGGAVAYNKGTVSNVAVGVGAQTANGSAPSSFGYDPQRLATNQLVFGAVVNTGIGGVVGYNTGVVEDCYFNGTMTGKTVDAADHTTGGTGGITGVNTGSTAVVRRGIVQLTLSVDQMGKNTAYGGIAGKNISGAAVENGIASGKITVSAGAGDAMETDAGGIAGLSSSSFIRQSISSVDIDTFSVKTVFKENASPINTGAAGGIAGKLDGGSVTESFSMGTIKSVTLAGGLVGYLSGGATVQSSYSVCAMNTQGHEAEMTDFTVTQGSGANQQWTKGVLRAAGGLVGFAADTGSKVQASYFAGSALKAEMGSLGGAAVHSANAAAVYQNLFDATVFFDAQVSPNRGMGANSTVTNDGIADTAASKRKNTADFSALAGAMTVAGATAYQDQAGAYPNLGWVTALGGGTSYEKLAKALSSASTSSYLDMGQTWGNAYRVQEGKLASAVRVPTAGTNVAYGQVKTVEAYTGVQKNETIGNLYAIPATVTDGGSLPQYALSLSIQRKVTLGVNPSASSAAEADLIPNSAAFNRLLDLSNMASGAYAGGVFALSSNVADTITVVPLPASQNALNNQFCATLDGTNKKVSSIAFKETDGKLPTSLFGVSVSGTVKNITFSQLTIGNAGTKDNLANSYQGFLFSRSKSTVFDTIAFDQATVNLDTSLFESSFGLLVGRNVAGGQDQSSNAYNAVTKINNITVQRADISIDNMGGSPNSGTSGMGAGTFIGITANVDLTNSVIQELNLVTKNGTFGGIGGFVGMAAYENSGSDKSTIENCRLNAINAAIGGLRNNQKQGFGGIVGRSGSTVNKCYVAGKISGNLTGASNPLNSAAGGITAFGNNNKPITNSTFLGTVENFAYAGGIVAYTNFGAAVQFCNVVGNISTTTLLYGSNADVAGGLISYGSNGNKVENSYFFGNVSGSIAGGLVGFTSGAAVQVTNAYAKAIITGTSPGQYIGGLIGSIDPSKNNAAQIKNAYFAGQLRGLGIQGAIAGLAAYKDSTGTVRITMDKVYFDKSIAGDKMPAIASISSNEPAIGAEFDAQCAVLSGDITAAVLGSGFKQTYALDKNYPNLANVSNHSFDDLSTRKVFLMDQTLSTTSYLTGRPNFSVDATNSQISMLQGAGWDNVLTGDAAGPYKPNKPGQTLATVQYSGVLPDTDLAMIYDIVYIPFEYGDGTAEDPYIIYNEQVLSDFASFVNDSFDTANTYYKIGSNGKDGKAYGDPITLDLTKAPFNGASWSPIIDFKGSLLGGSSVIKHLYQTAPYTADDGSQYYGFFATSTGNISDLTFDGVKFDTAGAVSNKPLYMGTLAGLSATGNYSSVHVINTTSNSSGLLVPNQFVVDKAVAAGSSIGGLVGYLKHSEASMHTIRNCTVLADIVMPVSNGQYYVGGIVGYANLQRRNYNEQPLVIMGAASYGSISGDNLMAGGILGGYYDYLSIVNMQACVSTMDMNVVAADSQIGGILGGVKPADNSAIFTTTPFIKILNSYYGGKLTYPSNITGVGGIAGGMQFYHSFMPDASKNATTNVGDSIYYQNVLFNDRQEMNAAADNYLATNGSLANSAYNYNINHVPAATFSRVGLTYKNGPSSSNNAAFTVSPAEYSLLQTARSSTQEMTNGTFAKDLTGASGGETAYQWLHGEAAVGYYPLPERLMHVENDNTQQSEEYLSAMTRFYSTGVYYTNAGNFGDNTFSNIYLLTPDRQDLSKEQLVAPASDKLVATYNKKMFQSTGEGNSVETITLEGKYNGTAYAFKKALSMRPSVQACGVSDSSFVYANPEGMWVSSDGTRSYPWTIYTADQLQGLTAVVNNVKDGNYIQPGAVDYNNVALPPDAASDAIKGAAFVLGLNLDAGAYSQFMPVCPGTPDAPKAFDSQLDGRGYVVQNLNITGSTELGLFGHLENAAIMNMGLVNPTPGNTAYQGVVLNNQVTSAGSFAAVMTNTSVSNCFSALPLIGDGGSSAYIGGLTGSMQGASNISRSFFTGLLYAKGTPSVGGIAGQADNSANKISNSYVAGFIQSENQNAAVLFSQGNVAVERCYYDLNAVGDLPNVNQALPVELDGQAIDGFVNTAGYYPLQSVFNSSSTQLQAAVAKVYMTNARSATGGSVAAPGYTLARISQFGDVTSSGTASFAADKRSFSKEQSGFMFLNIANSQYGRLVGTDLKCWYNNGVNVDGKMVYTISTAKELLEFSMIVNGTLTAETNPNGNHMHDTTTGDKLPNSFENAVVKLRSDVNLSGLGTADWISAGTDAKPFKGTFDGDGHVITLKAPTSVFGVVDGGTLQNLGLNGKITAATADVIAPLAQHVKNGGTVSACFSGVTIEGASSAAGLVNVLEAGASINGCYNMGKITGDGTLAGLVYQNQGTVSNSYNVGVIISNQMGNITGAVSGIAATGSGKVDTCFNAAYLSGLTVNSISGASGGVTNCAYDNKMTGTLSSNSGVPGTIPANFGGDQWVAGDTAHYPQLKLFAESGSDLFVTASELSSLIFQITGKNYQEFTAASLLANVNGQQIGLQAGSYNVSLAGDSFRITVNGKGAITVTASASGFEHGYYTIAQAVMKIRYEFDFTQLFKTGVTKNARYHDGEFSQQNTWDAGKTNQTISTPDDFRSFIDYVNGGGETKGRRYVLNYNIDFENAALPIIAKEFFGTFDGGYYALSNIKINGAGTGALFAKIGSSGRVENLALQNVSVQVTATASDIMASVLAAENAGFIGNVAMTDCKLDVRNGNHAADTYMGFLTAKNTGRITGAYARQVRLPGQVITHSSASGKFNGTLVGLNSGSMSGCYFVGSMINPISLIAGTSTGELYNCYYAALNGAEPSQIAYAYLDKNGAGVPIADYWLTTGQIQSSEMAAWLSSNIYGGAYKTGTDNAYIGQTGGTVLNDGYPYLAGFQLVRYDLSKYFSKGTSMLLSVWNTDTDPKNSSISNGVFALDNLEFKYFGDIIMHQSLQFNMHELPLGIDYLIAKARVYGKNASYKSYLSSGSGSMLADFVNDKPNSSYTANVDSWNNVADPNLIVVSIQFAGGEAETPWGNYRSWSSTTQLSE